MEQVLARLAAHRQPPRAIGARPEAALHALADRDVLVLDPLGHRDALLVGRPSQLDAVAMCMPEEETPARKFLDIARRMARHSLTEARRSVMDLRASALDGQDLAAALESGTRLWTAGSGVDVAVDVAGASVKLPEEAEQHLLRIAQEAVTNSTRAPRRAALSARAYPMRPLERFVR